VANQDDKPHFLQPTAMDRVFSRVFGSLVRFGIGFKHNFILEVRGRKSGRIFSTPVNLLVYKGRNFLCASRGETQWVRNARAVRRVRLVKGSQHEEYRVREVPVEERPELLKEFLERFATSVQRYYPVKKGAPLSDFAQCAATMPVFELIRNGSEYSSD
jgi:deazaflavin-dependent oxidoreductase (nitroreductase family)